MTLPLTATLRPRVTLAPLAGLLMLTLGASGATTAATLKLESASLSTLPSLSNARALRAWAPTPAALQLPFQGEALAVATSLPSMRYSTRTSAVTGPLRVTASATLAPSLKLAPAAGELTATPSAGGGTSPP